MDARDFLFEKGFSIPDQKEGYILKVEELIELLDEYSGKLVTEKDILLDKKISKLNHIRALVFEI